MSIELRLSVRARRGEHAFRREGALEHLVNLAHRHTAVVADREQRRPGFHRRLSARDTEEMPGSILHIGGIYCSMLLELHPAVPVASRIVERDAPLPELRRLCG